MASKINEESVFSHKFTSFLLRDPHWPLFPKISRIRLTKEYVDGILSTPSTTWSKPQPLTFLLSFYYISRATRRVNGRQFGSNFFPSTFAPLLRFMINCHFHSSRICNDISVFITSYIEWTMTHGYSIFLCLSFYSRVYWSPIYTAVTRPNKSSKISQLVPFDGHSPIILDIFCARYSVL